MPCGLSEPHPPHPTLSPIPTPHPRPWAIPACPVQGELLPALLHLQGPSHWGAAQVGDGAGIQCLPLMPAQGQPGPHTVPLPQVAGTVSQPNAAGIWWLLDMKDGLVCTAVFSHTPGVCPWQQQPQKPGGHATVLGSEPTAGPRGPARSSPSSARCGVQPQSSPLAAASSEKSQPMPPRSLSGAWSEKGELSAEEMKTSRT